MWEAVLANQLSSVTQLCLTFCSPMDCSTPGLPVHHQLPELTQTRVHWVGDAIQPSHPSVIPFSSCLQSFPASGPFLVSQFFTSGGQSIGASALISVLPMNIQDWFLLGLTGLNSFGSVQLSRSVVSDALWPHGLQHARPTCPSPTPGVYSNSCPLSWWCHPTISSLCHPLSSRLQFFPTSGSFPMSQFFTSGGQSIGVSASTSVLPMTSLYPSSDSFKILPLVIT